MTSDAQGRLWYGRGWDGGDAARFDPGTGIETVFTRNHGLPDEHVWASERDSKGGVWIGTGAGLVRAQGESIEDERDRRGLPSAAVFDIRHDATGTLWIATSRGLYSLDGSSVNSITSTNGLPDEHVWCSANFPDGTIWIGTASNGLIGYDGKAMTVLDKREGLLGNNVFTLAPEGDRSLWIGFLDGGLTRYLRSQSRPSVRLLEATLANRTLTNTSSPFRIATGDRVTIRYQEIDLKTHPEKRQSYYRLLDAAGQTVLAGVTKDRNFEWTPRQGGTFTFEVQAIDRDLNYSEPARISFRAVVPWFANAWITVPGASTFIGLFIWAFIARAIFLRQREQMFVQERRAREALEEKTRQLEDAKIAAETANHAKSTFLANMTMITKLSWI
ncbi:MAG: hypothetical protein O2960_07480 [Verrucomicrobia bacterium]|nr:hypothetical protein [Verrucomicrobiota bacterium]